MVVTVMVAILPGEGWAAVGAYDRHATSLRGPLLDQQQLGTPELGLPAFLEVGTRITWYMAAASVAQSRFAIVEDPACAAGGPGCYTDRATGKHYRKTDEGPSAQGSTGLSGDGVLQVDVVAIDGTNVSVNLERYAPNRELGQLAWEPMGGGTIDGVTVPGAWVHPAQLAQVIQEGYPGFDILVGQTTVVDQTVPTVSFVRGLGTSTYESHTYDQGSGLLVASSSSTGGPSSSFVIDGMPTTSTGNTRLTLTQLVGLRKRDLPGMDGRIPDWLSSTGGLQYSGAYTIFSTVDPTQTPMQLSMQQDIGITGRAPGSVSYIARTIVPGAGRDASVPGVGGAAHLYWWDPAALRTMRAGQVLDEDPITGARLVVAHAGPGANGGDVVVIDGTAPGIATRATYDEQGMLIAFEARLGATGEASELQLTGVR